jgi:hypothetical protein
MGGGVSALRSREMGMVGERGGGVQSHREKRFLRLVPWLAPCS